MGFDFEPDALGRTVDVPQRNELIAEKYFEIIGGKDPVKTIVFAASISHANNLRYALIRKFNALHELPPNNSVAESFIVTIHNQIAGASDLIKEFAKPLKPLPGETRRRVVEQALRGELTAPRPLVAVSVEMLSTGVDAPDIDMLVMARPNTGVQSLAPSSVAFP
jgi:type I restriction enzyme R subunit